ncbi:MAG: glycerophosphodiester phosphodiesterase family protein [Candidatus Brennerbacteria bacterium]
MKAERIIIAHRGLDPSRRNYFAESSHEAFTDQLARGFGLEFDPQLTADGGIVVVHDSNLRRMTGGHDMRKIQEVSTAELLSFRFSDCRLTTLTELLREIGKQGKMHPISALHLKRGWQEEKRLDVLLSELEKADPRKFIIFDVAVAAAEYLKERNGDLVLAPSVAHPYDVARYNEEVGGTLMQAEEVIGNRNLFDWVWLDEWDLKAPEGTKKFYTKETFSIFRNAGMKIALVTPELHATSPGLLGGEAHEDATTRERLEIRMREIAALGPDAVCTDYPDLMRDILAQSTG